MTEEYIEKEEKQQRLWCSEYMELESIFLAQIDGLLSDATVQSRQELLNLFTNQQFLDIYQSRTPVAYMCVIMKIYKEEIIAGERFTILDMGTSHEEITSKLLELKFLFWKIIFAKDWHGRQKLLEFIRQNNVTPYMLQYLVLIASVNKKELLLKLADLFWEQNMFRYTFHMLDYLTHLFPEDENSLCLAADFCGSIGNIKQAGAYLSRIKNPGKVTEGIRKKYGC